MRIPSTTCAITVVVSVRMDLFFFAKIDIVVCKKKLRRENSRVPVASTT